MDIFNEFNICRYSVELIKNDNKYIIIYTNNINEAEYWYNKVIERHINKNEHIIVNIFDYDKNTNIKNYDSEFDIS